MERAPATPISRHSTRSSTSWPLRSAFLTEQAQQTARRQQERSNSCTIWRPSPTMRSAWSPSSWRRYRSTSISDLLRLLKRLLRNGRNLDRMLDQLESLMDLAETMGLSATASSRRTTDTLQAAEQRGVLRPRPGRRPGAWTRWPSLGPEDLDKLADSLVVLLAFRCAQTCRSSRPVVSPRAATPDARPRGAPRPRRRDAHAERPSAQQADGTEIGNAETRERRAPAERPRQTGKGGTKMATRVIAGKEVHVNDEGFMTDPSEWDREIAAAIAARGGHP